MAPRRQRSERQSAVVPATAEQWFLQLPDGPCKTAMIQFLAEAHNAGDASVDSAMAQCLAYATNLFPEEIVLWGLDGALGPIPMAKRKFPERHPCFYAGFARDALGVRRFGQAARRALDRGARSSRI